MMFVRQCNGIAMRTRILNGVPMRARILKHR